MFVAKCDLIVVADDKLTILRSSRAFARRPCHGSDEHTRQRAWFRSHEAAHTSWIDKRESTALG